MLIIHLFEIHILFTSPKIERNAVRMDVINVRVAELRKNKCVCCQRKYNNLKEWLENPNHVYIGRRVHYVDATFNSEFMNPFQVKKYGIDNSLKLYSESLDSEKIKKAKETLKGKVLGCWCVVGTVSGSCHGKILQTIINEELNSLNQVKEDESTVDK